VNVNDGAQAPGNDPVANVNFNVTLQHGLFKSLPDLCKTSGVTPPSSLSADNRTLVCNLGTQLEGTAHAVQAAIVVDGTTGEEVSATGTIAGKTATIPPSPSPTASAWTGVFSLFWTPNLGCQLVDFSVS
jgi:hypothetical protein